MAFAVPYPLDDYTVIAVNLTGESQTLNHIHTSVLFTGLVYGRARLLGFGFPIGLTILPDGGKYIIVYLVYREGRINVLGQMLWLLQLFRYHYTGYEHSIGTHCMHFVRRSLYCNTV